MRDEIRSLTGLRGVAATWVLFGHYHLPDPPTNVVVIWLVAHYGLAVDMFMILSGFVLARTYGARVSPGRLVSGFRGFLAARLARVYPLYGMTVLVCLVLLATGLQRWEIDEYRWLAIIWNLLMIQSWPFMWPDAGFNGPAWSISLEWLANLLFVPLAVLLLHGSLRRATVVAGASFLVLVGFGFLLGPTEYEHLILGQIGWYSGPYSTVRCLPEFMLGMYVWRLRADWPGARHIGGKRTTLLIALLLLPPCLVPTTEVSMDLLFLPLACAFVLALSFEGSAVGRFLGSQPLHWLGIISYSVYLWQTPMLPLRGLLISAAAAIGAPSPEVWGVVLGMIAVNLVSWVSYRWFEMPMRNWLRARWSAPRQAGAGSK